MTSYNCAFFVPLSVAFFVVLAPAADNSVAEKARELEKFQGAWLIASAEHAGQQMPDEMRKSAKLVIKGNKLKVWLNGKEDHEQEIDIDPTKTPKEINTTRELNGQKSTVLGIYSFDGTTLKLCGDDAGKERPKEFSTKDKPRYSLMVLNRE